MIKLKVLLLGSALLAAPAFAQDSQPAEAAPAAAAAEPTSAPAEEAAPAEEPESAPMEEAAMDAADAAPGGIGINTSLRGLVQAGVPDVEFVNTDFMSLNVEQITYAVDGKLTVRWGSSVQKASIGPNNYMLTLPLSETGDRYSLSVNPYVDYQMNANMGVFFGLLITEFGGDLSGKRDEIGDNIKNVNVGVNYTLPVGGMDLQTGADIDIIGGGDEFGYTVMIPVGVTHNIGKTAIMPSVHITYAQPPFDVDAETGFSLHIPVLHDLGGGMHAGLDVNVDDLEEAGDTYRAGLLFRMTK